MVTPHPSARAARTQSPRGGLLRRVQTIVPLLFFPVLIYVVMTWMAGGAHTEAGPAIEPTLRSALFGMPMISGVRWTLTAGDALVFFSLVLLSFEIVKATSSRSSAMVNHAMSMAVLIFCLVVFLTVANFATSTFFLITMMALMDVLVGVVVSIVSARRDFGVGDGFAG